MTRHDVRPAAFLDRDGTIIRDRHYMGDAADVELLPGAIGAVRRLRDAGYVVVVVTNQSGIARGLYSEADFQAVQARVNALFEAADAPIDAVYHCPHHPDYTGACDCRKPATGLFRRAAIEHGLDLASSVFIGDRFRDVAPALELGGRGILVRTGYGAGEESSVPAGIRVADDVAEAAGIAASDVDITGVAE